MPEVKITTTTIHKVDNIAAAFMMAAYINKEQVCYEDTGDVSIDDGNPQVTYKAEVKT